jgi:hypothetical protein
MLEENQQQLVSLVNGFSDDELYHQLWYGKWTRGRMIQFNSASPYKNASAAEQSVKNARRSLNRSFLRRSLRALPAQFFRISNQGR